MFRAQLGHATQLKECCIEQCPKLFVQSMTMEHLGKRKCMLTNDFLDWYITVGYFSGQKAAICTKKISIPIGGAGLMVPRLPFSSLPQGHHNRPEFAFRTVKYSTKIKVVWTKLA